LLGGRLVEVLLRGVVLGSQGRDAASLLLGEYDVGLGLLDLAGQDVDLFLPHAGVDAVPRRPHLAHSSKRLRYRRLEFRHCELGEDIALTHGLSG
jgi:hypothetical protein